MQTDERAQAQTNAEAKSLIPPNWRLRARSLEDIVFFGRVTIQEMVRSWFRIAEVLVEEISRFDQKNSTTFLKVTEANLIPSPRNQRTQLIDRMREVHNRIYALLVLQEKATEKPAMPEYRPQHWFDYGDTIVCYLDKKRHVGDLDFSVATVVEDNPFVVVRYYPALYEGGRVITYQDQYGTKRPEIMKHAEFQYLLAHPDFAEIWARDGTRVDRTREFEAGKFLAALNRCAQARLAKRFSL